VRLSTHAEACALTSVTQHAQRVIQHHGEACALTGDTVAATQQQHLRVRSVRSKQRKQCLRLRAVQLEEDDDFDDFVNRDSWHETAALGDANMRALQAGDVIQLERKGYFKVDEAMTKPDKPLLLLAIPDGRQKK
jgi:hypothetical protein